MFVARFAWDGTRVRTRDSSLVPFEVICSVSVEQRRGSTWGPSRLSRPYGALGRLRVGVPDPRPPLRYDLGYSITPRWGWERRAPWADPYDRPFGHTPPTRLATGADLRP